MLASLIIYRGTIRLQDYSQRRGRPDSTRQARKNKSLKEYRTIRGVSPGNG
jgi:hypothetical protein